MTDRDPAGQSFMLSLREAVEASWDKQTARDFVVLDRENLGDSEATIQRCALLLQRVESYLEQRARDRRGHNPD